MTGTERPGNEGVNRVALVRSFPGLLQHPDEAVGRVVREVVFVEKSPALAVLLFVDDSFAVIRGSGAPTTVDLTHGILAVRPFIEACYSHAYRHLDSLIVEESEMARRARVANILAAIESNVPNLPELLDEIHRLLDRIGGSSSTSPED